MPLVRTLRKMFSLFRKSGSKGGTFKFFLGALGVGQRGKDGDNESTSEESRGAEGSEEKGTEMEWIAERS